METTVAGYISSIPAALLNYSEDEKHEVEPNVKNTVSLLPPLTESAGIHLASSTKRIHNARKSTILPQNMPQYRNVFNDRARRNFCYWLAEKKSTTCKGCSIGTYKTFLGIPKM